METKARNSLLVVACGLVAGLGLGLLVLFGCGVGGYLLGIGVSSKNADQPGALAVGSPVPDFALVALNGQQVRLSELRGYPVVINFWATWCGPCVAEMPLLQKRYEQYEPELIILAVNADEPRQDVLDFVNDKELTFSILLDPNGSVQNQYRIRAYPTSFFVDAEGILQAQYVGTLSEAVLDEYLGMSGVGK
jgi:thiol-disulfide isomerase/thioredoxin